MAATRALSCRNHSQQKLQYWHSLGIYIYVHMYIIITRYIHRCPGSAYGLRVAELPAPIRSLLYSTPSKTMDTIASSP